MNKNKAAVLTLILITALSAAVIAARARFVSGPKTAVIYKNGEIVREIDLTDMSEPIEFSVSGENGEENIVRAENGRIRIIGASCPDKLCVKRGWMKSAAAPIVCLPNRVTVEIRGGAKENEIDGMAGG